MRMFNKLKKLFSKQEWICLDIDRHYFNKPFSHFIFYRKSANGNYHVRFKREWLTPIEISRLMDQADPYYLLKCAAAKKFPLFKKKDGKMAGNWKKTTPFVEFLVLMGCGGVTHYLKCGYAIVTIEKIAIDFNISLEYLNENIFNQTNMIAFKTTRGIEYKRGRGKWSQESYVLMAKIYPILKQVQPEIFKEFMPYPDDWEDDFDDEEDYDLDDDYYYDDYDDYDDFDDLGDESSYGDDCF